MLTRGNEIWAGRTLTRHWVMGSDRAHGRQWADNDWARHNASCFADYGGDIEVGATGGARVSYEFDRETGLHLGNFSRSNDVRTGYSERIAELVREQGIPSWSMKPLLISPEALVALLDSSAGTEITALPFEVTPSITVFKTGTIVKWGSTMSFDGNGGTITSSGSSPGGLCLGGSGIAIATRADGLLAVGNGLQRIFVIDHNEDTICIRYGTNWIGLFHRDGRLLESAAR